MPPLAGQEKNSSHRETNYQKALKENELAKSTASRWQQLAAIPEEQFEQSVNATKEVMGEVTTASLLSQAKKKKRAVSRSMRGCPINLLASMCTNHRPSR